MPRSKTIAVLSTGRQDFGILHSTLAELQDARDLTLRLWVGGMHLKDRFGRTVGLIEESGLAVARRLDFVAEPPAPIHDAARAVSAMGAALEADRPDALLLAGDRAETLAAGFAATLARVPIAHLHGGEETEGAIDNALRHALTKLSHLHLVSHETHAERVRRMGEDPETVVVVGAPGLDYLYRSEVPDRRRLEADLQFALDDPVVIVTVHPTTLGDLSTGEVRAVARAMEQVDARYVVTQPNADQGGGAIRAFWSDWAGGRPEVCLVDALGPLRYWSLLRTATAMLGNSSSGIIEAPSAGLPIVNVGERQRGRLRSPHVVDVAAQPDAIIRALRGALVRAERGELDDVPPVYPTGPAAPRIVDALRSWTIPTPPRKVFVRRQTAVGQ